MYLTAWEVDQLNAKERLNTLLHHQAYDRPLNFNIMMAFAADYIQQPLSHYYLDYHVLCEANFAVLQDFDLDIVQAISDPYREASDAGLEVDFPPDNLPLNRRPLLIAPEDLRKLEFPKPTEGRRMSDRLEAVRLFREQVGGSVPVMGWVEGALAEAADLRGVSTIMTDLIERPEWVNDLLEQCVENQIAFARAQVAAGADIIGLGDAIASQISPAMYRKFALPYEKRIFATVRDAGGVSRLHICGNTSRLLVDMAQSGAEIIDIDWMVDMAHARDTLPGIICGNLDPVAIFLQGSPEQVREGILANAKACPTQWISAAGCEIPRQTPHANLHTQTQALHSCYS